MQSRVHVVLAFPEGNMPLPTTTFLELPPEILAHILCYLPIIYIKKLALVCRRCKVVVYSNLAYRLRLKQLGYEFLLTQNINEFGAAKMLLASRPSVPLELTAPSNVKIKMELPDASDMKAILGTTIKEALAGQKKNDIKSPTIHIAESMENINLNLRGIFKSLYLELYDYYMDFEKKTNNFKVFTKHQNVSEQGAVLSTLIKFDKCGFLKRNTENIGFNLRNAIEGFQSNLLARFEKAYNVNDIKEMKRTAEAVSFLDGKRYIAELLIEKNPIFFENKFVAADIDKEVKYLNGMELGDYLAKKFTEYIQYLLDNCLKQISVINIVLPNEIDPLTDLISKLFEESILDYFQACVKTAKIREGAQAYLLVHATAVHCLNQFALTLGSNSNGVKITESFIRSKMIDGLSQFLVPFVNKEMQNLKEISQDKIDEWENMVKKILTKRSVQIRRSSNYMEDSEHQNAHRNQVLTSMKKLMFAPVAYTSSFLGSTSAKYAEPISDQGVFTLDAESPTDEAEDILYSSKNDNIDSIKSLVSIDLALNLMHLNKESLRRILVVSAATDIDKLRTNVQKCYILLLKLLGEKHVKPAFRTANDRLENSAPVEYKKGGKMINENTLQFFDLIHVGDLIQQMLMVYYNEDIRIWIDETDFLSDIMIEKKAFERLLDDSVATGMDRAIQVLINQCEFLLLSGQGIHDYNPNESNIVFDFKPTPACQHVIGCLEEHIKVLKGCLDKSTMEVFQQEVCVRLFHAIIKNIRRLQISQAGAMQLISDFNRYYEWVSSLRMAPTTQMFAALKELGNLFLADGTNELQTIIHDVKRYNGALRPDEISELLQSRADYKEIKHEIEAKECCIQ